LCFGFFAKRRGIALFQKGLDYRKPHSTIIRQQGLSYTVKRGFLAILSQGALAAQASKYSMTYCYVFEMQQKGSSKSIFRTGQIPYELLELSELSASTSNYQHQITEVHNQPRAHLDIVIAEVTKSSTLP